jgi:hypothetical protein
MMIRFVLYRLRQHTIVANSIVVSSPSRQRWRVWAYI